MLDEAPPDLVGDFDCDVTGPALAGVESDDADRVVFAREQFADDRLTVCACLEACMSRRQKKSGKSRSNSKLRRPLSGTSMLELWSWAFEILSSQPDTRTTNFSNA